MPEQPSAGAACHEGRAPGPIRIEAPLPGDGRELWRLTRDSGELDLNSPYCYVLWCRDFSRTSVVAREGSTVVGFVTGHVRPDADDTLFVWQVAVSRTHRGQRIGRRMLDELATVMAGNGCRYLEATVTPDNLPSARMFASFARAHGAPLTRTAGFGSDMFPDNHQPEELLRIGPFQHAAPGALAHKTDPDRRERKSKPSMRSPS